MELTFPIDPTAPEPSSPRPGDRPRRPGAGGERSKKRNSTRRSGTGDGAGPRDPRPPKKAPPREEDHDLPRGVRISLLAHGAFLIALLIKGLVFPGKPMILAPTLRVDLVGLPDILKKDLSSVPKTSPGLADALKKADEAAKEELAREKQAALEEKKAKAEEAEEADPDELVLQAKQKREAAEKARKEREAREDRARERKLKNALARIKALSKIEAETESEKMKDATEPGNGVVIKGNRLSGGSSLDANAREGAESSYFERVRSRLIDNWSLPVWLSRQNLQAQVLIFIDSRGRLHDFRFTRNSGNASFDEAVRRALRDSQPFPAPPSEIASGIEANGILVGFPL